MKSCSLITKRILCLALAALMLFSLASCGKDKGGNGAYATAAEAADALVQGSGISAALTSRDKDYASIIFASDIPDNFAFLSSDDGTADMAGVFVCEDDQSARNLDFAINTYIGDMKEDSAKYKPEEAEKLEGAVIECSDNVVVLCVSGDGAKAKTAVADVISGIDKDGKADAGENTPDISEEDTTVTPPSVTATGELKDLGGIVRIGDTCYECWYYNPEIAQRYASAVKKVSAAMPSNVKVYNMLIPLSSSITLPDNYADRVQNGDQSGSIKKINDIIGTEATHINIYDTLMAHRNEYIYFRTDHHWTGLGAYYAYNQFLKAKGKTAAPISSYQSVEFDGFLGEFYTKSKSSELKNNPDKVIAYYPVNNNSITMTVTESSGKVFEWPIVNNVNSYDASLKYSTFAGADNPYTEIKNSAVTDGSTCIVIKESFGNALVPFIADNYSTVYVIDYRYYSGNIRELVPSNGNVDILFANNLSMMQNSYLAGKLELLANSCK